MLFDLKSHKVPQFNESQMISNAGLGIETHPSNYADLDWWIKRTPELVRVVSSVQEDILGEGAFFEGAANAVKKAELFWNENFVKEEVKKALFDWLLYGDGYLWIGHLSDKEREEVRFKAANMLPEIVRHYQWKADEDEITFIRHAPTTTMNIDLTSDKTAIQEFRQIVNGESVRRWSPENILHGKYWTVEGKVYGFSPARALIVELQNIGYIKDYSTSWFKGGGWPDMIFNFPNEAPKTPRVNDLVGQLQKYKHPVQKHGNMVTTGELETIELNKFSKDMEFRQLLIQLTGIIAHAYGLPAGRISAIIGAEVRVSTGSDDLANEAYWGMIRGHKDYWETLLNTQVFSKFGKVKIHFPQSHKVDEVRQTQSKMQLVDYLTNLRNLGVDFKMSYVKDLLGIENEHLNSEELKDMMPMQNARQNLSNNREMSGSGSQAVGREKQKQSKPVV